MKLFKFLVIPGLLLLCSVHKGSATFIVPILLGKLIALKGALFIGTPIALGAFVVGQGIGFLAGNLAGGYTILKAAQKYHDKEKAKWAYKGIDHGWKSPKYTKAYSKGFHIGTALKALLAKHKYKPSYHDYYDDYGGGSGYSHPSKGYDSPPSLTLHHHYPPPSHSHGYSIPSTSYGYQESPYSAYETPPTTYGGYTSTPWGNSPSSVYGSPSSGYSYPFTNYGYGHPLPPPQKPSLMQQLTTKITSFLGGGPSASPYSSGPIEYSPYSFNDGSYSSHFNNPYTPEVQNPINTYYPYKSIHLPGETYSAPTSNYASSESDENYKYSYTTQEKMPGSNEEQTGVFEDSEYTYSDLPYAKPTPKRPIAFDSYTNTDDNYPQSTNYDGPAKEYTGMLTDIFETMQKMKQKSYGSALGKPMGLEDMQTQQSGISSFQHSQRRKDKVNSRTKHKTAPNQIVEKFVEHKLTEQAKNSKTAEQRKEARALIALLRKAYLQDLADSLRNDARRKLESEEDVPDYSTEEVTEAISTPSVSEPPITTSQTPTTTTERTDFIPVSTISYSNRFKREDKKGTQPKGETANPLLSLSSEQLEQVQLLYTFMEEIKQFFTLVAALDEDTCLQKMVCDVHARTAGLKDEELPKMSQYESNMISTFKIMDLIIPYDTSAPEDSSTKYRLAAKLGAIGHSGQICNQYYAACSYTADEIIDLGHQVGAESSTPPGTTEHLIHEETALLPATVLPPVPSNNLLLLGQRAKRPSEQQTRLGRDNVAMVTGMPRV